MRSHKPWQLFTFTGKRRQGKGKRKTTQHVQQWILTTSKGKDTTWTERESKPVTCDNSWGLGWQELRIPPMELDKNISTKTSFNVSLRFIKLILILTVKPSPRLAIIFSPLLYRGQQVLPQQVPFPKVPFPEILCLHVKLPLIPEPLHRAHTASSSCKRKATEDFSVREEKKKTPLIHPTSKRTSIVSAWIWGSSFLGSILIHQPLDH